MTGKSTRSGDRTHTTAIAYYRVSTQRQGASGLGLEGQQAAVEQFVREQACELLDQFTEVESGRKSDRPVLRKALARAKATRSVLVIGKLDRLARNVHFISGLMEAGVEFRACDMPSANRLTVHILAAVAEDEARRISDRTKAALAAYRARGGRLGAANPACRKLTAEAALKGSKRTARLAHEANKEATTIATELRAEGMSLPAIAGELDARGVLTRTGKTWNAMQVLRLLRRAA
jgi:DNA invertase Pin-like site-specific DNA recombinase